MATHPGRRNASPYEVHGPGQSIERLGAVAATSAPGRVVPSRDGLATDQLRNLRFQIRAEKEPPSCGEIKGALSELDARCCGYISRMAEQGFSGAHQVIELIRALADDPEQIRGELVPDISGGAAIRIVSAQSEIGRIVGVNGRTARALRTLVNAVGSARGRRYTLDIQCPEA